MGEAREAPAEAGGGGEPRETRTAYLAMLAGIVGGHRWYLGHRLAGALYVIALAAVLASVFLVGPQVGAQAGQLLLVAVALFAGQLALDAMALPRWVVVANRVRTKQLHGEEEVPWPALIIALIALLVVAIVGPIVLEELGNVLQQITGSARIGEQFANVVVVLIGVPTVLVGYIVLTEQSLRHFPGRWQPRLRPWLWLFPALAFLTVFLLYPTFETFVRSLYDQAGQVFIGFDNYVWFFQTDATLIALRNNVLWLVFFTLITVGVGLAIAILLDRVRYESPAKTIIFIPMAISFVAAAVIWRFMYDWSIPGTPQTGTLNAIWVTLFAPFNVDPIHFLGERTLAFNNFALIAVGAWMWTGFCMVILSAGLKGISTELLEAARVDGATEWHVFRHIILPLLMPTIAVVSTTMIIFALKTFDIIFAMTAGSFDTQVIAFEMWQQFRFNQFGRASAVAVVLLAAIIPVMLFNIKRFREQEAIR
jgi:alpha-glucoside transport system permease protein